MDTQQLLNTTLEQLEFPRLLEHIAGYAASEPGAELVLDLSPMQDADYLRQQIAMISEARAIIVSGDIPPMNGIYDIRRGLAIAKVSGSYLSGEDMRSVLTTLQTMRVLREFLERRSDKAPLLSDLAGGMHTNKLLERHINDAVDETGNVRDNASKDLHRIRRDIIDKSASLRSKLQRILKKVSDEELLTDDYVTLREGRLVLPVRTEYKRKIQGIIHGESNTGGTVFLEPAEVFDMNNEIAELTFAERREVERILRTLTQELGAEADEFRDSVGVVAHIDSLVARAYYAERYNCVAPVISTERQELRFSEARHPLLLLRIKNVVPVTLSLDVEQRCIVISGPNAGGKTVAMKTAGLVTVMALCAIHPPADDCTVHSCNIFSDIGDQQSLENDLSTFSSHISRIGSIVEHAGAGDLILLDEVGSGTDPDEGGAIAAAILDHLLNHGAFILATTHQGYLKTFAYNTNGVVNAGMEFNTETITPTYRCHVGTPGNSYAFELIERLGFPSVILKDAKVRMGSERNQMTDIIARLQEELEVNRHAREEQQLEARNAKELREVLDAELKSLRERKQSIVADARSEAKSVLDNANSLIENTIREIRSGAGNEVVKGLREQIKDARKNIGESSENGEELSEPKFRRGDQVRLKGNMQTGELDTDPDENGNVVVQLGALRMRAHIDDLEVVSNAQARQIARAGRNVVTNVELAESRIDLRGMYSDEAIPRIEQAITAAVNANLKYLEIIHGKGTGALRQRIHDYLKRHPGIASYRLGTLTEGGAGVTIVELK